jgi:NTP pyrophosphatase (non-canonical NTP hydrolase)
MTFEDYQKAARSTAIYPQEYGMAYVALGLTGEAGEVADKIKKIYRDTDHVWHAKDIAKELGDVLWYLANAAHEFGYTLEDIAKMNAEKLSSRAERGVLQGSGDER